MISNIQIDNNHEDSDVFIEQHHVVTIGRKSYITFAYLDWGSVRANVMIGRYTSIAHRVVFEIGLNHDHYSATTYPFRDYNWDKSICATDVNHYYEMNHYQIIIGNDVWIGEGVKILSGVHIGNGAVIGMGAVVTRDIPPYAIAVGNPAKVVKYRFDKDTIAKLEDIKWWNWDESVIGARLGEMQDPVAFADKYYEEIVIHNSSLADEMDQMRQNGCKIFYFVADYDAPAPLWNKVVEAFIKSYRYNNDQMLIIEVPKIADESASEFLQKLDDSADGCSGIRMMTGDRGVPSEFYYIDTYIVGNDIRSLAFIDAAESAGINIESGCDWERGLFENKKHIYIIEDDNSGPLVSICIPTYNRSKYLRMTLDSIVRQPEFISGKAEVVISDNCSEDDTETLGREYAARYLNVRYFRNEKNITGRNFNLSLARGRGKLRKINNDTCIHSQGSLEYMCHMVEKYDASRPVVYFGNRYTGDGDGDEVLNLEQFLVKESFHITWIGSFAIWGDECEGIADEYIDGEFLWQVRKLVSMIKAKGYVATCDKSCMAAVLSSKNYNAKWMWQVFHDDYLNIIRDYINEDEKEYIEKDLLFNHFGEIALLSEQSPQNITLDEEYDDEIASHYKKKPYWDEFCKYYEDMMTRIRQQKNG